MGTRFPVTPEANAHPIYQQKLVASTEEETMYTLLFGHASHETPSTADGMRSLFHTEHEDEKAPHVPGYGGETVYLFAACRFVGISEPSHQL